MAPRSVDRRRLLDTASLPPWGIAWMALIDRFRNTWRSCSASARTWGRPSNSAVLISIPVCPPSFSISASVLRTTSLMSSGLGSPR